MNDKATLRRMLLAERAILNKETRTHWDDAICKGIMTWWQRRPSKTIGVYWPIRGEPDLHLVYRDLALRGVQLALPMVSDKDGPLRFLAWQPGDPLTKDAMGVSIPANTNSIVKPDVLLIPCVGFNAAGFRLGYGGGFYDRTLSEPNRPFTIGIAYSFGRVDFDNETHDIALDMILTEE
jgi:5-formyltetrahydrofolate cyclo-ligase